MYVHGLFARNLSVCYVFIGVHLVPSSLTSHSKAMQKVNGPLAWMIGAANIAQNQKHLSHHADNSCCCLKAEWLAHKLCYGSCLQNVYLWQAKKFRDNTIDLVSLANLSIYRILRWMPMHYYIFMKTPILYEEKVPAFPYLRSSLYCNAVGGEPKNFHFHQQKLSSLLIACDI